VSLLDAYEAAGPKPRDCAMVQVREKLNDGEWTELLELARRPDVEATRLARILQARGLRISSHVVGRHLRGRCQSCAARGDFT